MQNLASKRELSHTVSVNQDIRSDLPSDSTSESLMKLKARCQLGFSHLKACLGLKDLFQKWLSYMAVCWLVFPRSSNPRQTDAA